MKGKRERGETVERKGSERKEKSVRKVMKWEGEGSMKWGSGVGGGKQAWMDTPMD